MQQPVFFELLLEGHRQTEQLLSRLREVLDNMRDDVSSVTRPESLPDLFQALKQDLLLHFACEEHGLLAVLTPYRSMVLMHEEHDQLWDMLEAVETAMNSSGDATDAFNNLDEALRSHILEEETGVFQYADQVLEPEEKALVARKSKEFYERVQSEPGLAEFILKRPEPHFDVNVTSLFQMPDRPIHYQTLFEREHTTVQRVSLKAGKSLSRHWAAQYQFIVVLSGQVRFISDTETVCLEPGMSIQMDPHLYFAFEAQEDTQLLLFKVWPRPHFLRG